MSSPNTGTVLNNSFSLENFEVKTHNQYAFIFGNEVRGVSQLAINQCDGVIEIPQEGTKHSLNVAVASGVVLWDFFQKLRKL